jgi:hypothetical protein
MTSKRLPFLADQDDFGAIHIIEPHGVVALNGRTDEIRIFSWRQWLRERGGIRQHYRDLASGRTVNMDHLEFCELYDRPGLFHDELGRSAIRVPAGAIFLMENAATLLKVFSREQLGALEVPSYSNCWDVPSSYTTAFVHTNATTS